MITKGKVIITDDIDSVEVNADGSINAAILSSALPTGASTYAAQTDKSQFTKITDGTDTVEISSAYGEQKIVDGLRNGGVHGNLLLVTAGTAYEAKVGGSRLSDRKLLTIRAIDNGTYWGYDNTVTTTSGTPLDSGQFISWEIDPDSNFQVWLVNSTNNRNVRITESP